MNYLPKRRKHAPMRVKDPGVIRSPGHMKFVRGFACAALGRSNHTCDGKMHAHHVRAGGNGGVGMKPDDSTCVPLCATAHEEVHRIGHGSFERKYNVDLLTLARALWRASAHRLKWERESSPTPQALEAQNRGKVTE